MQSYRVKINTERVIWSRWAKAGRVFVISGILHASYTPRKKMRVVNMVVLIRNLQSRTLLNLPGLLQNCNTLVDILRISYFDVNVIFVGKGFIKSLNLRYRRKNVVTDILSFPSIEVSTRWIFVMIWEFW